MKSFITYLTEKKDHIIKRLKNLTDDEKDQVIAFFNKKPNLENKINWHNRNLTFKDFQEVMDTSKTERRKAVKKHGIAGLKEGKDFLEIKMPNSLEDWLGYIPLHHEASKLIASKKIGGVEGKWCISYQKDDGPWFEYIYGDKQIPIFMIDPNGIDGVEKYAMMVTIPLKINSLWTKDDHHISPIGVWSDRSMHLKIMDYNKDIIHKARKILDSVLTPFEALIKSGQIVVRNARYDIDRSTNKVTWKGGTWISGEWEDDIWEDGTWESGDWWSGTWKGGEWRTGDWRGGIWKDGDWMGGTWWNGEWEDGNWHTGFWRLGYWRNGEWWDGTWKDGSWFDGEWWTGTWSGGEWHGGNWQDGWWEFGNWRGGTWINGVWKNGIWDIGLWKDGEWRMGEWKNGTWNKGFWRDGNWKRGTWKDGTWEGGIWQDGTWKGGDWIDGKWEKGTWENGTWWDGRWVSGTWKGGTWKGGYDRNGNYHEKGDSPDKWDLK